MVKCTGRGLVVKRPEVLSKVQTLNLVLGVGVFSPLPIKIRKEPEDKNAKTKTSENFAEEKMFAEDITEDFSEDRRYHFHSGFSSISGYLRNLRRRLLSSEKFSEVFTLWVFLPLSRFQKMT